MAYSLQGRATTGRRQYSPLMTGKPPYFPKKVEAIPEASQEIVPSQPVTPRPLSPGPPADMDTSQGLAEGFSDPSGFAPTNQANLAGLASQKGDILGTVSHGLQGLMASTIGMPASIVDAMLGPVISKGYKGLKGLLGFDAPANSGSAVPSGTGVSGLSGPMGLASVEAANTPAPTTGLLGPQQGVNQAPDLADLDIGNFGGGPGMGGGGLGNDGQGAFGGGGSGLGMGLGGDGSMGEW